MDLNDRQRKFAFAGVMVALAAIGIYLTMAAGGDRTPAGQATPGGSPVVAPSQAPATSPPGIGGTISPDTFDIYRLLPFSQRDFAAAADVAQRFTALYGTYRYDEDPQAYVQRLQGLVTDQLRTTVQRDASTPGLIDQRRQDEVVAQATASLDAIRDIGSGSVMFLVTERQQVTKGGRSSTDDRQFAVTVSRDGGAWRVYAFEPADAGQAGDTG